MGIVREQSKPREVLIEMPVWVRHLLSNAAAYADFYMDLDAGVRKCESGVVDLFAKDEDRKAAIMTGKRDALRELLSQVEMYRKEEETYARRIEERGKGGDAKASGNASTGT